MRLEAYRAPRRHPYGIPDGLGQYPSFSLKLRFLLWLRDGEPAALGGSVQVTNEYTSFQRHHIDEGKDLLEDQFPSAPLPGGPDHGERGPGPAEGQALDPLGGGGFPRRAAGRDKVGLLEVLEPRLLQPASEMAGPGYVVLEPPDVREVRQRDFLPAALGPQTQPLLVGGPEEKIEV